MRDKTTFVASLVAAALTIEMFVPRVKAQEPVVDNTLWEAIPKQEAVILPKEYDNSYEAGKKDVQEVVMEQTEQDIELMAAIVHAEAGNQSTFGKELVATVILNRVDSEKFPDNVHDVIYQKNQFSVVRNGALKKAFKEVDATDYEAVYNAIDDRPDYRILFFDCNSYNGKTPAYQIGDHYFSF